MRFFSIIDPKELLYSPTNIKISDEVLIKKRLSKPWFDQIKWVNVANADETRAAWSYKYGWTLATNTTKEKNNHITSYTTTDFLHESSVLHRLHSNFCNLSNYDR